MPKKDLEKSRCVSISKYIFFENLKSNKNTHLHIISILTEKHILLNYGNYRNFQELIYKTKRSVKIKRSNRFTHNMYKLVVS